VLPTAAAAALVVTATGATMAESAVPVAAPLTLDLSGQQSETARTEQAADEATVIDLAVRRQDSSMQTAALQGRVEAQQRAARDAKRKAAAKAKAEREGKKWVKAIRSGRQTSDFGPRWGRNHDGLDVAAPTGTPLYAMSKGTVVKAGYSGIAGNKLEIRYWDGTASTYHHMSRIDVKAGQSVLPGDVVGAVGNTGRSFGAHLHIEIHPTAGDNPIDPYPWLKKKGILIG
jgi:murein DD-endopeptidase MepM/ murein hydrolase activator NlpD